MTIDEIKQAVPMLKLDPNEPEKTLDLVHATAEELGRLEQIILRVVLAVERLENAGRGATTQETKGHSTN